MFREMLLGHEHELCQKLQQLRLERGWSQADVSKRLSQLGFDLHQTTIAKLEAGKRPLRVAELMALSLLYDRPAVSLFYLPLKHESEPVQRLREQLREADETIAYVRGALLEALQMHADSYAKVSEHRRRILAELDQSREASTDGEH